MKVLFISSGLRPEYGGPAISESSLVVELRRFCEVRVLCPANSLDKNFAKERGLAEVCPFRPVDVAKAYFRSENWVRKEMEGADLVHINGHWRWENHFFARLARLFSIPYVFHPRGMCVVAHRKVWLKRAFNFLLGKYIVRNSSCVIVLSRFEIGQLKPYGVSEKNCFVQPNGVSSSWELGGLGGSTQNRIIGNYYLYLGRLESRKNLLFLVSAFAKYREQGGRARLVCIGPVERNYDKEIRQRSLKLGVGGEVEIMPPVYGSDKWEFMKRSLAVVYPSCFESFGRVPFEAVSVGVYPIVPDESGAAEYLGPYIEQSVYRHQDEDDLAAKLHYFEKVKGRGRELNGARAWVARELNWSRISERVFALYQHVLDS